MTVTVSNVRIALNDITTDELADSTIVQKIETCNAILTVRIPSPVSTELFEIAVRDFAAYLSFSISNVFTQAKFGPLTVRRDIEDILAALKKQANDAIKEASGGDVDLDGTIRKFTHKLGYFFADRDVEIPDRAEL